MWQGVPPRFEFRRALGSGGEGQVSLVADRLRDGELVVLKRLTAAAGNTGPPLREFETLAGLHHPSLASVHDFGRTAAGEVWYTRAFADGEPPEIVPGGMAPAAVARLLVGIADALAPLHLSGLLHGDVKPANVIVDSRGGVTLIDFSFVRPAGGADAFPSGTLPFVAPEILREEPADARSDLYALGCLGWGLLAGRLPYDGTTTAIVEGHLKGEPPPLPDGPGPAEDRARLATILRGLLAPRPADRPPDVGELRESLLGAFPDPSIDRRGAALPALPARADGVGDVSETVAALLSEDDVRPILLAGEPGSGRTTLMRAVRWGAQLRGATVIALRGRATTGWRETLEALLRAAALARPAGSPGTASASTLSPAQAALAAAAKPDSPLLTRLRDTLLRWRGDAPVILAVDDAHHLPESIRPLVRALIAGGNDDARRFPTLISGPDDPAFADAFFAGADHRRIPLRPLDERTVGDLVRRTFGRTDPERTAAIARATGGNPALVYETLRAAAAAGLPFLDDLDDADVARRRRRIWSDRLERLGPDAARLLLAVAAAGVLPDAAGPSPDDDPRTADARLRLLAQRLVRRTPRAELVLDRPDLRAPILAADPERTAAIAAELLVRNGTALPSDTRLRLAVAAGRTDHAAAALEPGVDRLLAAGNPREAADILEWWFAAGAGSPAVPETRGRFLEALDRSGEPRRALALARSLPAEDLPFDLLLLRARLAALAGEDAETDLAAARARTASPAQRAAVAAVAGRARLRRGDSAGARSTAESALPDAPAGPDRIELLLVSGLARDYLDDPDTALARFAEAADEAKRLRADDLLDKVRAHEAFTLQRLGRLDAAADRYRGCLDAARAADDRGALANHAANLGAVLQLSGRLGEAIRHFEDALAAARWVGRAPTALSAQANLANGLAIVGRFESALRHAEEAAAGASRTGLRRIAVQARGTVADVAMRRGALDEAAARFDEVERAYEEEGLTRERWEAALHALDCRLRLGRRADDRLAEAARAIDAGGWDDLRPRLELARARTALLDGDAAAAAAAAARSHETAERRGDLAGVAEAAEVRALAAAGDEDAARRFRRDRKDALERLARDLPEAHRAAFAAAWNRPETDPAGVGRTRAARSEPPTPEVPRPMEPSDTAALFRLLEINRELVRESDPERLLEAIIDSAVRFTGAERGFLLLPDARGDLEIRRVREFSRIDLPDEHRRFSRSIAEQVYRDGEPVITVSAMDDQRFGRFLSVHELRLQSILCVPIRGRERTLGVLYLENRVRRGLFGDADRDLLTAFGDQAALAIENAHLIETLRTRSRDLEEAHRSLERLVAERERLLAERTEQLATARRDLATARRALASPHGFPGLVGESAAMRRTFQLMRRVLDTDVPVTLAGESGTGKEVVARAIHDHGPRKKARFVAVNCGALPESLIESELFGHARGAFTGAVRDKKGVFVEAHGGTLLLDEVGDMPARMQTDLLRALQEARIRPVGAEREIPVDVRIIAASQVPLADLVAAGRFREDLFYRLNVVEIPLPALRERIEDLPLLVDHFLSAFATRFACERKTVTREAFRYLASLPWPGNVRQLEHALLNAWVLAEGDQLGPEEFGAAPLGAAAAVPGNPESTPDNRRAFEADERQRMLDALRAARWNKTRAATTLGMPRRTFYRKLARYGLDR